MENNINKQTLEKVSEDENKEELGIVEGQETKETVHLLPEESPEELDANPHEESPEALDTNPHEESPKALDTNPHEEEVEEKPEEKPAFHAKKHLNKPLSRSEKRKKRHQVNQYEKAYKKRKLKSDSNKIKTGIFVGLAIVFTLILSLRYFVDYDMNVLFLNLLIPSYVFGGALIILSFIFLITDRTMAASAADPITDFFIVNKGRLNIFTRACHMNRVNTRFMMVTLLKLFSKEQIAIVNGKIIYGTMDGPLSDDEVIVLNFLLDHNIVSLDDFVSELKNQSNKNLSVFAKRDDFYFKYKATVVEMAEKKAYINHGIHKAKLTLLAGAGIFGLIALSLIAHGQFDYRLIAIYTSGCLGYLILSHLIYAHSKGAHQRVSQLRKEKRLLQSAKSNIYTSLIYTYIFKKEAKILKRIQKKYSQGQMSNLEYTKFSETYNSFNYMIDKIIK